ncbi:TlpA family protein disulfide reductase [Algoriphagus pacificus]|uniref:TlpA family protein disulfide reductase n=1 Tax=Algoriphagus pacificus TaxID=2811234 RepID=A0ABS3CLZ7_9BACT|nr:TlpA disulfide reductase family protein [Algoriphagus pacificus]MBN7818072.1 TlpA family protein disulfide reductase [Algoriphagus pacificus]
MKKILFTCLLGYLCLPISISTAQVADPPGADPLHRSMPPRGGDSRSEPFFSFTAQDIDGGPSLLSPACPPWRVSGLPSKEEFSLVDDAISLKQGGFGSPAGEDNFGVALFYGELINPDSLSPLAFSWTPYFFSRDAPFMKEEALVELEKGEFYDGVSSPRVRKFSFELSLADRAGYFTLTLGDRPLLEDYLVYPGDSVKIDLDLFHSSIVFGGPDAVFYEVQYALKRLVARMDFDAPMVMFSSRSRPRFQKAENQALMEKYKTAFGSHFQLVEVGKEAVDYFFTELDRGKELLAPQLELLEFYKDKLDKDRYDLLLTEVVSGFYGKRLSSFRKFHYPEVLSRFSVEEREKYLDRILVLFSELEDWESDLDASVHTQSQLVSAPYLNLAMEKSMLKAIFGKRSYLSQVAEDYSGEMEDRLLSGYLSQYMGAIPDAATTLDSYLAATESSPWKDRLVNLGHAFIPGETIIPVRLEDMEGQVYTEDFFKGQPTLLYFYFSSCAHSADFFQDILFPLYQDTQNLGYRLVAISMDDDREFWKSRISKYSDLSLTNLITTPESKKRWRDYYEIHAFPKTMLLDGQGRVVSFNLRTGFTTYEAFKNKFIDLYREQVVGNEPKTQQEL